MFKEHIIVSPSLTFRNIGWTIDGPHRMHIIDRYDLAQCEYSV